MITIPNEAFDTLYTSEILSCCHLLRSDKRGMVHAHAERGSRLSLSEPCLLFGLCDERHQGTFR